MRDELEEELRNHLHHRADDLERSGISRAEAERQARLELADSNTIGKSRMKRRAGVGRKRFCGTYDLGCGF